MINYTKQNINKIALFMAIILFIIINSFIDPIMANSIKEDETNNVNEIMEIASETNSSKKEEFDWYIEIPKINLVAPISEGTDLQTLEQFVGHFTETKKENGNVGLAAHNRGYTKNYFENLKELELNDEIYYKCNNIKKKFIIDKKIIIKDTDWSYLQETNEDKITMITCVENNPEYRRCLQATYTKGENE